MREGAFQDWRRERDEVELEMDRLITAGFPTSAEQRQARRSRFAALVERRDAAARYLLQSDRRDSKPRGPSRPGNHFISTAHGGQGAEVDQATFVPVPDGRDKTEGRSGLSANSAPVPVAAVLTDVVAPTLDAGSLDTDPAAVTAPGVPEDFAAAAPDVAALHSEDAAANVANAKFPSDAAPHAADANAPSTLSSDGLHFHPSLLAPGTTVVAAPDLLANSELPADAAPPASDLAAFPQSSDALFPHYFDAIPTATPPATYSPVVVATPDDAAPLTAESRTSPAPSSDNLNSGAFMNMLRRLQLSIKPGG